MFDPRKYNNREEDREITTFLKSTALLGTIAYGGIRLVNRYNKIYDYTKKTISANKEAMASKLDRVTPIIAKKQELDEPIHRFSDRTLDEVFSSPDELWEYHTPLDPLTDLPKENALFTIDEEVTQWRKSYMEAELPKEELVLKDDAQQTNIADLNKKLADPIKLKSYQQIQREVSTTFQGKQLENAYKGITAWFQDIEGIELDSVRLAHEGWSLNVRDIASGNITEINMPDWRRGYIRVGGAKYRAVDRLVLPGDVTKYVEAFDFGTDIMIRLNNSTGLLSARHDEYSSEEAMIRLKSQIKKALGHDIELSTDKGKLVKDLISKSIQFRTDEYVGNVHSASTLSRKYQYSMLDKPTQAAFTQKSRKQIGAYLRMVEGKIVKYRNILGEDTVRKNIDNFLWDQLEYVIQVPGISEQGAIKGKIASKPGLWTFPFMQYSKQAQQRIDWQRGVELKGAKLGVRKLGALLGPATETFLQRLDAISNETIPGRVANVAFHFEDKNLTVTGEIPGIGDGGAVFIEREKKWTPGKTNIDDWTGSVPGHATVLYEVKNGEQLYESRTVRNIIEDAKKRVEKGERVTLEKGQIIGYDPIKKTPIKLDADVVVENIQTDAGIAEIHYLKTQTLQGGTKMTLSKAQVETIKPASEVPDLFSKMGVYGKKIGNVLSQGSAETGIEFIMNADMMSKYMGGGMGLGILQKTLNDVSYMKREYFKTKIQKKKIDGKLPKLNDIERKQMSKELQNVAEIMLGSENVKAAIKKIDIDDEFGVSVILNENIATDDPITFRKLLEPEHYIRKGQTTGDWEGLIKWTNRIEKNIKEKVGNINNFRMSGDLHALYRSAKTSEADLLPTFIMEEGTLKNITARVPMILHSTSAYPTKRFAGSQRTIHGYERGVKLTIDHIRNAHIRGMPHYVRYLQHITDYNMDYIENKVKSATSTLFAEEDIKVDANASDPRKFVIDTNGKRKPVKIIDMADPTHNNLWTNLIREYESIGTINSYFKFRLATDNSANILGYITDERLRSSILQGVGMDIDSMIDHGILGRRGNSVAIVSKDTMNSLYELVNTREKDEAVLLKLPEELSPGFDHPESKYVMMHDFNQGDMFELLARDTAAGEWKTSYFTGNDLYQNQMHFISEIAHIDSQLRNKRMSNQKRKQLQSQVHDSWVAYKTQLHKAFSSKFSPIKKAMIETGMPLSTMGNLRSIDDHMLTGVRNRNDLFTMVGTHIDDTVATISGGEFSNLKQALSASNQADRLSVITNQWKGLQNILDENINVGTWDDNIKTKITNALNLATESIKKDKIEGADSIKSAIYTSIGVENTEIRDHSGKLVQSPDKILTNELSSLYKNNRPEFVRKANKNISAIINILEDKHQEKLLGSYTLRSLQHMIEGTRDIKVGGQGYPENSYLSGMIGTHVPLSQTGITSKTFEEFIEKAVKESAPDHSHIFLSNVTATSIGRDFDKDPISMSVLSLDTLDEISKEVGLKQSISERLGLDPNKVKGMDREATIAMVESQLVYIDEMSEGRLLKPANAMSLGNAAVLEKLNWEKHVIFKDTKEYLKEKIRVNSPDINEKELNNLVKDISEKRFMKKLKEMHGDRANYSSMKVATGLVDPNILPDMELQKMVDRIKFNVEIKDKELRVAKNYPDLFHETIGKLSPSQARIYEKLSDFNKESWVDWQNEFRLRETERFAERKLQTALAYGPAEALNYLIESYSDNEKYKTFVTTLADKGLTQHALNSKKGTPLILTDLLAKIKVMMDPESPQSRKYLKEYYGKPMVTEKFFDDLASGNLVVELPDSIIEEMRNTGYIKSKTEKVDFELYEKYLQDRNDYLTDVVKANSESLQEITMKEDMKHTEVRLVNNEYRKTVESKMESMRIANPGKQMYNQPLKSYLQFGSTAEEALIDNMEMMKNIGMGKNIPGDHYIEPYMAYAFKDKKERNLLYKKLATDLWTYRETAGRSILDNQSAKAIRQYTEQPGKRNNILDVMADLTDKAIKYKESGKPMPLEHIADRWIYRTADFINKIHPKIKKQAFEDRHRSLINIEQKELKKMFRLRETNTVLGSNVFRAGNLIDTLSGKINKVLASSADDKLLNKINKTRVGSIIAGLFMGALAGQTVNQISGSYSVPDLEQTKGLGGEYYENISGIIGREAEIMLKPRAPRVTSSYKDDINTSKDVNAMMNMYNSTTRRDFNTNTFQSKFKGVIIR